MNKKLRIALLCLILAVTMTGCQHICPPTGEGDIWARSYNCAVYREQGCAKMVVASGGELEAQSGATFDLQAGVTTDFSSGVDLDGALLDLDADGNTSIQADTDDQIDIEIGGADDFQFTANLFEVLSGSAVKMNGGVLDLDADDDTSITASTDDQIDVEIGGADIVVFKEWGTATIAASTTEHLVEIQDATPVITGGTVSLAALNIDLGIGNSTGGTNNVYGILVDTIVGDAENTETAINVGEDWDVGLDLNGNVIHQDLNEENVGGLPTVLSVSVITSTNGAVATVAASEIWIVHAVYFKVATNFDCSGDDCTLIVGDGNDTDGFLVLVDGEMQTTIAEITGAEAGYSGMYTATTGAYLSGANMNGFIYDGAETIDIMIEDSSDNSDPTAGAGTLYILYTRLQ